MDQVLGLRVCSWVLSWIRLLFLDDGSEFQVCSLITGVLDLVLWETSTTDKSRMEHA